MVVGAFMFFIGMLQFKDGFKNEVTAAPFSVMFLLICGLILILGSFLVERRIRRKATKESKNETKN